MIRASLYIAGAGAIWLAEGFLFSRLLQLAAWQTGVLLCLYIVLFLAAVAALIRTVRDAPVPREEFPVWRHLALAPMLVTILGSFLSLPLVVVIALLGRILG